MILLSMFATKKKFSSRFFSVSDIRTKKIKPILNIFAKVNEKLNFIKGYLT